MPRPAALLSRDLITVWSCEGGAKGTYALKTYLVATVVGAEWRKGAVADSVISWLPNPLNPRARFCLSPREGVCGFCGAVVTRFAKSL